MHSRFAALIAATFVVGACAHAQPADDAPTPEDTAIASARDHHLGHRPFAVAMLAPFNEPGWYVASFFHYWVDHGQTAQEAWAIRYVHGDRGYTNWETDREIPATPATTQWADSQTCPALKAAVARFQLQVTTQFAPRTIRPPSPGQPVVSYAIDVTTLSFWARLSDWGSEAEISFYEPYEPDAGVSSWMHSTLESVSPCLSALPPLMPTLESHEVERTLDVFYKD